MTRGMRARIFILQAGLIGIFAFGAVLAFGVGSFVHGMIHDQLTAQQIYFPAAGSAALPVSEFPDLQQYGGQQLDDGIKAQAYANGFIGRHLQKVAGGQTYAQVSAKAQANPTDQGLQAQVNTLFKGETLRGTLLNTYGWWTVGTYAIYAGVGLAAAALAVLIALASEISVAVRHRRVLTPLTSSGASLVPQA
jgi:hypothetical protein